MKLETKRGEEDSPKLILMLIQWAQSLNVLYPTPLFVINKKNKNKREVKKT